MEEFSVNTNLIYYGELDSYSGSILFSQNDYAQLIKDLKYLSLFFDTVLIPTEAYIRHPLLLPAFEELSLLAKGNVICTSTSKSLSNKIYPVDLISRKLELMADDMTERKGIALAKTKRRWSKVLSTEWIVSRNINTQKSGVIEIISDVTESVDLALHKNFSADYLSFLSYLDDPPSRTELLSSLAYFHKKYDYYSIKEMFLIVQMSYFKMGQEKQNMKGKSQEVAMYPGSYASQLASSGLTIPERSIPYYHNRINRDILIGKYKNIGVDLYPLLKSDQKSIVSLRKHSEWLHLRKMLLNGGNINEIKKSWGFITDYLSTIKEKSNTSIITFPTKISVRQMDNVRDAQYIVSLASFGLSFRDQKSPETISKITYDAISGILYENSEEVFSIKKSSLYIFNYLLFKKDVGVSDKELRLLILGFESLHDKALFRKKSLEESLSSKRKKSSKKTSYLNRLKNDIFLHHLDIKINKVGGRHYLVAELDVVLGMEKNGNESTPKYDFSSCMKGQEIALFHLFLSYQEKILPLSFLTQTLNDTDSRFWSGQSITKRISKIRKTLEATKAPIRLVKVRRGEYMLTVSDPRTPF